MRENKSKDFLTPRMRLFGLLSIVLYPMLVIATGESITNGDAAIWFGGSACVLAIITLC